jgi:hypothetical protein
VTINLDFTGNKVIGTSNRFTGQDRPVAVDLAGPAFADAAGSHVTIGCLPPAEGYSATRASGASFHKGSLGSWSRARPRAPRNTS